MSHYKDVLIIIFPENKIVASRYFFYGRPVYRTFQMSRNI